MSIVKAFSQVSLVAAGALLAAAAPAAASNNASQPRANAPAASQAQRADNPNRRICVEAEMTGSRLNRRICKTAQEWEATGGLPIEDR